MQPLSLALALLMCLTSFSMADESAPAAKAPVPAKLEDLAFLKGCWKATHWGGEMEECWSAPLGDNLQCMYRFVKDGKVQFYEFIVVEQMPDGLYLRLKHFNAGLVGWEEKEKSLGGPITGLGKNKAVFDWLTYELASPDLLVVSLRMKHGDKVNEEVLEFQRIR